jgi:hypothetical protein
MKSHCPYCDPKQFIIFGFCENCKRRCEPPFYDPDGDMSLLDYEEFRNKWNEQRSDLILDAIRQNGNCEEEI